MGLWLARQLCDHVAIRRDADGISLRLTTAWPWPAPTPIRQWR
jgi:hypothetical protein